MKQRRFRAALVLLFFVASSVPAFAGWKQAMENQPFVHQPSGYSVQFPPGWKYSKLWFSDESGATRDGPGLQSIFVDFRSHAKAFKAIKKVSTESMLAQDLAQNLIADMTKERGLESVSITSNEPAIVAGRPGFRVTFEYRAPVERGSVRVREIVAGATGPKGLYLIGYRAPVLYYYSRDVGAFDAALASFAINSAAR